MTEPDWKIMDEMDYKRAYNEIVEVVARRFPECSMTTVDMVRLLAYENDTLRIALSIPPANKVLSILEEDCDDD